MNICPLQQMELNFPFSKYDLDLSDSLLTNRVWKGKNGLFRVEKPGRHHFNQLI